MSRLAIPVRVDLKFDGDSPTVNYVGEASFGSATSAPVWRIKRITYVGNSLAIDWADDNDEFDNVWDDRTTLNY